MESPVCPLCKCQDNGILFYERGYSLFVCNSCELFFIDPYPQDVDIRHDHVSEYDFAELKISNAETKYLSEVQLYKKYFSLISLECKGAKSILDIGCGTGHLLERLVVYPGLLRVGIELNRDRAQMAKKIAGCEILQVPIEKYKCSGKFDVITMINVLSHIPSHDDLFNSLKTLMPENGKLILKVSEMKKDIKKGAVFDWEIPDHLHFLGLKTINVICEKYGFEVLKHLRTPFSDELFSRERFISPGRSAVRNYLKKVLVYTPLAISLLSKSYNMMYGKDIYSSFIVLGHSK
jgi:SAM-dependent methyltransferase